MSDAPHQSPQEKRPQEVTQLNYSEPAISPYDKPVPPGTRERARFIRQILFIVIWLCFSGVSVYFLIRIFGQH